MSGSGAALSSRWLWHLLRITRRIWFRASLFSLLAVLTALLAIWLAPYIPDDLPAKIGSDAVDNILSIIASSMLAVTTFSLSTMVTAYGAATSNVTPRATQLVIEDTTTQNVLATFVGSFLYSLVGIIVLSTGAYGQQGRVVLFAVTVLVIVLIVVTLLRWMDHLAQLGRVANTTQKVEGAALAAMRARHTRPYLGGRPLHDSESQVPPGALPLFPDTIGYVQHLDMGALSHWARRNSAEIYVSALPGDFIDPTEPVAWVAGALGEEDAEEVRRCFTVGDMRSFDQDPRFGASVLSEIASRALSPGINDPGTAIDVIGRAVRVLAAWAEPPDMADAVEFPAVHVPPVNLEDLFDDLFTPIARDGAGVVEVAIRLQKALLTLARLGDERFAMSSARHSREALERAEGELAIEADKQRVRAVAAEVTAAAP